MFGPMSAYCGFVTHFNVAYRIGNMSPRTLSSGATKGSSSFDSIQDHNADIVASASTIPKNASEGSFGPRPLYGPQHSALDLPLGQSRPLHDLYDARTSSPSISPPPPTVELRLKTRRIVFEFG
ncbi:uncharacterized protein JCM15063_001210 [Sporobolomyces koalae]|uniref:uncharacterized protein n=1 Tax=Sporobolomyces koalae TaxID=500713 RepID=UPI00316D93B8